MELKQIVALLRHWVWLLIAGLIIGAIGGILISILQNPVYEATTKVLITRAPQQSSAPDNILDDQQLTQTFTQLLTIQPVLDAASEQLGFEVDPKKIQADVIMDTQIVQVTVEDHDPYQGALIANTLVEIALQQYSDIQSGRYIAAEGNIQAQIDHVEDQIDSLLLQINQASELDLQKQIDQVQAQMAPLQEEVNILQQEIAKLTPSWSITQKTKVAEDQARIDEIMPLLSLYQEIYSNLVVLGEPMSLGTNENDQLTTLQSALDLYKQIYASLVSNMESIRLAKLNNTSTAVQIEPAIVPEKAVRPRPALYTVLAAFCGLLLAGGSALLIEYLDDTIKAPDEVKQLLNLPVLGYIAETGKRSKGKILADREFHSLENEAFRSLMTNLEFVGVGKEIKTILVTSSEQAEGKTTIAANLAATFAKEGKRVLLLDADMRKPSLHQLFNISNESGLADILNSELKINIASHSWEKMEALKVIPSGKLMPNSLTLLGSEKMVKILDSLKKSFDVILIDTPPCFVADAQVLADKVDAVVMVVQPRHTHRSSVVVALEQFTRTGVKVIGVVLNRIHRSSGYYYDRYRYYTPKPNGSQKGNHSSLHRSKSSTIGKPISSTPAKEKENPPTNEQEK